MEVTPAEWKISKLGDLGSAFRGLTGKKKADFGQGTGRYVTFLNVMTNTVIDCDMFERVNVSSVESQNRLINGDLLFNGSSETPEEIALCALLTVNLPDLFLNSFCFGLRLHDDAEADGLFLAYYLRSEEGRALLKPLAQGSTRYNLSKAALLNSPLRLPSLPEQTTIAEALSDMDKLLGALEALIAKKQTIKQATMQQLLNRKDRLPGFSEEWKTRPFEHVLVRLNAKANQIQTCDYHLNGQYPVVDQGKKDIVGFSDKGDLRFRCPDGGVIVFGDHTCIVKFINFDFLVGADGTQILRALPGQFTRYHAYQLQHKGIASTGYNRHFKFLKDRKFLVPPLSEQAAIATVLSDMDAEIDALERRLDKTRAIKQGMMQQLLTGRTRLVNAEASS